MLLNHSGRGKGHGNSDVHFETSLDALKAPQGRGSASYTWGQRRKKWSKASAKTQYDPLQADCNTAFPIFLRSTDVQALVCREAKPRPNRTNYVCGSNRSPEHRHRLWHRFRCKYQQFSNTGIYTKEPVWDIFLSCKRRI